MLIVCTVKAQTDTLKTSSLQTRSEAVAFKLKNDLALTDAQALQVIDLAKERILLLRKQSSQSDIQSINIQERQKLSSILTKEQYDKFLLLRASDKKQKDDYLKANPNFKFSQEDQELDL
jgi:hypothetical protein